MASNIGRNTTANKENPPPSLLPHVDRKQAPRHHSLAAKRRRFFNPSVSSMLFWAEMSLSTQRDSLATRDGGMRAVGGELLIDVDSLIFQKKVSHIGI